MQYKLAAWNRRLKRLRLYGVRRCAPSAGSGIDGGDDFKQFDSWLAIYVNPGRTAECRFFRGKVSAQIGAWRDAPEGFQFDVPHHVEFDHDASQRYAVRGDFAANVFVE